MVGVGQQLDWESRSCRASAGLLGATDLLLMFYSPLSMGVSPSEQVGLKSAGDERHRKRARAEEGWE